jgi:hypothetical protein
MDGPVKYLLMLVAQGRGLIAEFPDCLLMQFSDGIILLRCVLMFPPAIGASESACIFIVFRGGIAALRTSIRKISPRFCNQTPCQRKRAAFPFVKLNVAHCLCVF